MLTRSLSLALALAACAPSPTDETSPDAAVTPYVDPTGTWATVFAFGADNCGHPATSLPKTFVFLRGSGNAYLLGVTGTMTPQTVEPGATVACTTAACTIDMTLTWMQSTTSYVEPIHLTLDRDGRVMGFGSETTQNSNGSCTASASITGARG